MMGALGSEAVSISGSVVNRAESRKLKHDSFRN